MLGRIPAKQAQIIFVKDMVNQDDDSTPFKVLNVYDVHHIQREPAGLCIKFTADSPEYFHPWHIIERVRIVR